MGLTAGEGMEGDLERQLEELKQQTDKDLAASREAAMLEKDRLESRIQQLMEQLTSTESARELALSEARAAAAVASACAGADAPGSPPFTSAMSSPACTPARVAGEMSFSEGEELDRVKFNLSKIAEKADDAAALESYVSKLEAQNEWWQKCRVRLEAQLSSANTEIQSLARAKAELETMAQVRVTEMQALANQLAVVEGEWERERVAEVAARKCQVAEAEQARATELEKLEEQLARVALERAVEIEKVEEALQAVEKARTDEMARAEAALAAAEAQRAADMQRLEEQLQSSELRRVALEGRCEDDERKQAIRRQHEANYGHAEEKVALLTSKVEEGAKTAEALTGRIQQVEAEALQQQQEHAAALAQVRSELVVAEAEITSSKRDLAEAHTELSSERGGHAAARAELALLQQATSSQGSAAEVNADALLASAENAGTHAAAQLISMTERLAASDAEAEVVRKARVKEVQDLQQRIAGLEVEKGKLQAARNSEVVQLRASISALQAEKHASELEHVREAELLKQEAEGAQRAAQAVRQMEVDPLREQLTIAALERAKAERSLAQKAQSEARLQVQLASAQAERKQQLEQRSHQITELQAALSRVRQEAESARTGKAGEQAGAKEGSAAPEAKGAVSRADDSDSGGDAAPGVEEPRPLRPLSRVSSRGSGVTMASGEADVSAGAEVELALEAWQAEMASLTAVQAQLATQEKTARTATEIGVLMGEVQRQRTQLDQMRAAAQGPLRIQSKLIKQRQADIKALQQVAENLAEGPKRSEARRQVSMLESLVSEQRKRLEEVQGKISTELKQQDRNLKHKLEALQLRHASSSTDSSLAKIGGTALVEMGGAKASILVGVSLLFLKFALERTSAVFLICLITVLAASLHYGAFDIKDRKEAMAVYRKASTDFYDNLHMMITFCVVGLFFSSSSTSTTPPSHR
ncbi:hypothetical protein CYMTET_17637 [Cymbomonas tetramitiformis]|uniref:Uncharacterized protein n=1 Tax=Cymbomonas tetramitiformis TaxID=36881 RepID=A0AAE0G9P9_9CHLO|nr:hypothetical protein CYMTET_17637 [Cymbomonas tetramitiformis]